MLFCFFVCLFFVVVFFSTKGSNNCSFLLAFLGDKPSFKMQSKFRAKNSQQQEQILSSKS